MLLKFVASLCVLLLDLKATWQAPCPFQRLDILIFLCFCISLRIPVVVTLSWILSNHAYTNGKLHLVVWSLSRSQPETLLFQKSGWNVAIVFTKWVLFPWLFLFTLKLILWVLMSLHPEVCPTVLCWFFQCFRTGMILHHVRTWMILHYVTPAFQSYCN